MSCRNIADSLYLFCHAESFLGPSNLIVTTLIMPRLVAIGIDENENWRRELVLEEVVRLGRAPRHGWAVPWDMSISREHIDLELTESGLHVRCLKTARNPIIYKNKHLEEFVVLPGEVFQIGRTTFQYYDKNSLPPTDATFVEHIYTSREMHEIDFGNSSQCLNALCKVPQLISESMDDEQIAAGLVGLILDALQDVSVVAVINFDESADYNSSEPKLLRWDSRKKVTRFSPSRRLMAKTLQRQCNVIHMWDKSNRSSSFTMSEDLDWAFCTPIPSSQGRWCLYVTGKREFVGVEGIESPTDLLGELRFAELAANLIGSIRKVRWLELQQSQMKQFFSPAVVEMLVSGDTSSIQPREGTLSVLFCDVRGFSRKVEQSSKRLDHLLQRVSYALSAMTSNILRFEGVIADFQGDAALAFWGWPNPLDDGPLSACRAAISIYRVFQKANEDPENLLCGFQIGIALGCGHAIAGQIGTDEQIKVGVFGPVVNLTSRLEGLTKQVGASILIDGVVAEKVREVLGHNEARIRHIARMRPCGMDKPTEVHQLLPTDSHYDEITDEQIAQYERAVAALTEGDWKRAQQILAEILPEDGPANFLRNFLVDHRTTPPDNWDGAINLLSK